MPEIDDPLFNSVQHALRAAFNNAGKCKTPCMMGCSSGSGTSWDERAGDAGNILAEVRQTLTGVFKSVVYVQYINLDNAGSQQFIDYMHSLKDLVRRLHDLRQEADERYIGYLVRRWANVPITIHEGGFVRLKTDADFVKELGVTDRTLRNWRNGRYTQGANKQDGLNQVLDDWHNAAICILAPKFRQNGWIA